MKKKVPKRTHNEKEALKKTSYETHNNMNLPYNIGQTAGGSEILDSDDIPGGFAGISEDMLESLHNTYQSRKIDRELQQ